MRNPVPVATTAAGRDVLVVGVGQVLVAEAASHRIETYSLGSCVALTAWDPTRRIGGMVHFLLSEPPPRLDDVETFLYATTAVPGLIEGLESLGCARGGLVLCAAGGADVFVGGSELAIGRRNLDALRDALGELGLELTAESTGGNEARTMKLEIGCGTVSVRGRAGEVTLWEA